MSKFFSWLFALLFVGAAVVLSSTSDPNRRPLVGIPYLIEMALIKDCSFPSTLVNNLNFSCSMSMRKMKDDIIKHNQSLMMTSAPNFAANVSTSTTSGSGAPNVVRHKWLNVPEPLMAEHMNSLKAELMKKIPEDATSEMRSVVGDKFIPRIVKFFEIIGPIIPFYLEITLLVPVKPTEKNAGKRQILENALLYECEIIHELIKVVAGFYDIAVLLDEEERFQAKQLRNLAFNLWDHHTETLRLFLAKEEKLAKGIIDSIWDKTFHQIHLYSKDHLEKIEDYLSTPFSSTIQLQEIRESLDELPLEATFKFDKEAIVNYVASKEDGNLGIPHCIEYFMRVCSIVNSVEGLDSLVSSWQMLIISGLKENRFESQVELCSFITKSIDDSCKKGDEWRKLHSPLESWLKAWALCLAAGHPLKNFSLKQTLQFQILGDLLYLRKSHSLQYSAMKAALKSQPTDGDKKSLLVAMQSLVEADHLVCSSLCLLGHISMARFDISIKYLETLKVPL